MARPDLRVTPLRGNANTRLRKLAEGACDATLLAFCGLQRLGLESRARSVLSTDAMLPSAGQGALGVECRGGDDDMMGCLAPLACPMTTACLAAERALLAALDGSCRTPVAALAEVKDEVVLLRGMLFTPDGKSHWSTERQGAIGDAAAMGRDAGQELRRSGGAIYEAHLR
jgi:hydroxymethylbilane synthase